MALFGPTYSHFPPYSINKFSTLLVYLALLFYEIYFKYQPYSFIRPYLFNWHLRVISTMYTGKEHWLGLDNIFKLTNRKNVKTQLKIILESYSGIVVSYPHTRAGRKAIVTYDDVLRATFQSNDFYD